MGKLNVREANESKLKKQFKNDTYRINIILVRIKRGFEIVLYAHVLRSTKDKTVFDIPSIAVTSDKAFLWEPPRHLLERKSTTV